MQADGRSGAPDETPDLEEEWRRQVRRLLGGREPEVLTHRTWDDIPINPLYRARDAVEDEGLPGLVPWLRGARATGQLPHGWRIHQLHRHPDPRTAGREMAEDLARGVDSIWLRADRRLCLRGEEPDGVVLIEEADFDALWEAFRAPGEVRIRFDAGPRFAELARLCAPTVTRCRRRGLRIHVAIDVDPLGSLVRGEASDPGSLTAWLRGGIAEREPGQTVWGLLASGLPYHDAGASDGIELAAVIASTIEMLRWLEEVGLEPHRGAARVTLQLAADAEVFATAAKLRAARRLWAEVMRHCGADTPPVIHAVSASRMISRVDPWTNMLRVTAAVLGSALGGADLVTALPFDHAIGLPDRFSRRIARNTQLVLSRESRLHHPVDPLGGGYFPSRYCDRLAEGAWKRVREIEAAGGMREALARGLVQRWVEDAWARREEEIRRRRDLQVGVGSYVHLEERARNTPTPDLAPLRRKVEQARREGRLAPVARDRSAVPVLPCRRFAEPFERLRARSDAHLARSGSRPHVLLLCMGRPADHMQATIFARNLFEAGGIEAIESPPLEDPEDAVACLAEHRCPLVTVCSGPSPAGQPLAELARRARETGARRVFLAGGDRMPEFDAVLIEGLDVVSLIEDCYSALEESEG